MKSLIAFFRQSRTPLLFLAFLLLLHAAVRVFFLWHNYDIFASGSAGETGQAFWWGLKMDLSAVIFLNAPVFLLFFGSQYSTKARNSLQSVSLLAFILLNAAGLVINIIDIGYFRFIRHRINIDVWYILADSAGSFPGLALHYWPLLLLFIFMVTALTVGGFKIFFAPQPLLRWPILLCIQSVLIFFLFIGVRGWKERPLIPASPLLDIEPARLPLAQNSIGTLFYSLVRRQHQLTPGNYLTKEQMNRIVSSHSFLDRKHGDSADSMSKKNVVICILESFSRCYLMPGDPHKAYTPFFDSLIRKSIFFPDAHANGFISNQGIVAILGGMPSFLDEPFYYSEYANTPIRSIGNILKANGYNTNFFLGAGKDHFGFQKFTHMAGIDHYYCQPDFNDDRYYDGNWGIFDEPFFQFGAGTLSKKKQPFLAVFFNISSHPPFTIPPQYLQRFNLPGKTAAQRSISYVDYSFQRFFETCKKAPWFQNTIFVFCADHWLDPEDGATRYNYINATSIPIFIYDPSRDSGTVNNTIAAQVDLAPTILSLLNYKGSYTGFGKNLLDSSTANNYALSRIGDIYQVIARNFVLGYDRQREKSRYLYRYSGEELLGKDLLEDSAYSRVRDKLERIVKANIQCYNQALINRNLE